MPQLSFRTFLWRVTAVHVLTYFVAGLIAFTVFDYSTLYATSELRHLMRPTTSAWVAAGPALQVVRGVLMCLVLWPFRERLLGGERGGLALYGLMVGLAVLGTAGPSPGSLEGLFFTTLPVSIHLVGLPEVLVQTAAFSAGLVLWCRRPARWINVVAGVGLALVVVMSGLGVLDARGLLPK